MHELVIILLTYSLLTYGLPGDVQVDRDSELSGDIDLNGDIDSNGPEPLIPHTPVNERAQISLCEADGCSCREVPNLMSVFYGSRCEHFPSTVKVRAPVLKFRNTIVRVILKDDFQMLDNITSMEIESNQRLSKLEPGCFRNMNKLMNLSISFNENIQYFDESLFEGLYNLKELYLRNDGFTKIVDAAGALAYKFLPVLELLTLNRNTFKEIYRNDFMSMEGTTLKYLNFVLCQIERIDSEALKPLKNLIALRLGENLFSAQTVTDLVKASIGFGIPLRILNLYEVGFRVTPPKALLDAVAQSNITYLNLGRNHFEHLTDDSFPYMPNLETLVLRDDLTVDISDNAFKGMPKLKHLILNGNRISYICDAVLIKTLILLDLSSNSFTWDTHFDIPEFIFKDMAALKKLQFSNNQIEFLTKNMFHGLSNLTILELDSAYITDMEPGVFEPLTNLRRLNLENNNIGTDMVLTANVFKGLSKLQVLLLGRCHIFNITTMPSIFTYMPNLYYVGLQKNGLHVIYSHQFPAIRKLHALDLSDNSLITWNARLFSDVNLKYLNGRQNKFTTISLPMAQDFTTLQTLILDSNPFSCDCTWYPALMNTNLLRKPSNDDYISANCVSPEQWHSHSVVEYLYYLKNNTDVCLVDQHSNKVFIITFSTIFLVTALSVAVLCYYYRWNIRYWIFLAQQEIAKRQKQMKKQSNIAISKYEYKYDAFVSYSNEDKAFVDKLVNVLENYEPYLKLCVYERDFQIGTVISESVMQNIAMSKRILLIVSEAFAKSQWCRWEMHLAECHQLSEDAEDGLVLVLLEKLSGKQITPFLKYIMKSRIYLEWNTDQKKEKVFWDKLRNTLGAPKTVM